ncbi:hypothetical protein AWENTII_003889 [Aspergillus wentii]
MSQLQEDSCLDLRDRPTTGASNDPLEHIAHVRSRSIAHANSPKRLSVFGGRSRSNTTTSTTSSRPSPASSMTSTDASSVPSVAQDDRTPSVSGPRTERSESVTKSLFFRGSRILRRQGSKFNIAATLDEVDEGEREKPRFEVSDIFGRHRSRQSDTNDQLKRLISDPFDFHHLTHTSPSQFQSLDRTRENDLVTEFSAIRASQRPVTGLKGIRAEDIHFRDFSSEDLTYNGTATSSEEQVSVATTSPPASPSSPVSPKQTDLRARRESRVCENFSRPGSRFSRAGATTPPSTSPKLGSSPDTSEPAPRAIDEILGLSSRPTYPEHVYSNGSTSLPQVNLEGMFQSAVDHPFIAGPDMGANARASASLTSLPLDLEDVPEEEEVTHWHDSPEPNPEYSASRASSRMSEPPTAGPKSICISEELSKKFSEALASPTLPQYRLSQEETPAEPVEQNNRRQSNKSATFETIYESWDADIDYCYEHAAESTSNFDWSRNSLDEPRCEPQQEANGNRLLHPIHLSTSALPTPDLDPSPSRSLPSAHAAVTPSTSGYEGELVAHAEGDYFQPVSSSIFPSALGKQLAQDTFYDEYLAADVESERHFSFCSQGVIPQPMNQPVSPRSSLSPISKCNSQESLILSRAASIVRKHRSSISTTSVPELVHSLASSREQMPSSESLAMTGHPDSFSHHRQTKSLEMQVLLRTGSSGSFDSADVAPLASPSLHDRAKSTSDFEAPLPARATKADAPAPKGHGGRKKSRTASYSLFPSTTPAN